MATATTVDREAAWGLFLNSLNACDFHAITKAGDELILHDRWVAGEITTVDIADAIIHPERMDNLVRPAGHSIKVPVTRDGTDDPGDMLVEIIDRHT